jgi:colanic acid/amylovoran biosynthesis glycosyltransferase
VHVHSCADALTIALIARLLGGARYGMTLHNPLWVYGPGQALKWSQAAYAIVITRALERSIAQELGSSVPRRLGVAPMGVDCNVFRRSGPYRPYEKRGDFRIACCARLNVGKGHLELISALAKLRDTGLNVALIIAGEDDQGGRGFRRRVEALIGSLALQQQVQLLGAVSEESVVELLAGVHVFALASHDEPLGVAIMEAMAMELPVVVARSEGVCELVEDGVQGVLFEPHDVDALARALAFIATNPGVARSFGQSGRSRVGELFSTGRSARLIQSLL